MKTKLALFATWLAAAASLAAAPLTATTAVQTRPDDAAPVVSYLKAGTEPTPAATAALANTPAGWMAVDLVGPFEAYVENKEIGKGLDVRPDASIYLQPKLDSGVLTTMEKGDKVEITGLRGKWTQVHVDKKLVGYIRLTGVASNVVVAPVTDAKTTGAPTPAPLAPTTSVAANPGQPAPAASLGDGGSSLLPRLFQGKFASSKRPFAPRRPYDYQLNDDAGVRYAYLDLSKLLLTDAIENYLDHVVVVFGTAKNVPGTKDIVIEIESLQLK